jgi:uncharacterized protein YggE
MKRKWVLAIALASIVPIVALSGCGFGVPGVAGIGFDRSPSALEINLDSQQTGIWVIGQGKTMAAPDIATLRVGIEAQEVTVAEAQVGAVAAMDGVMKALTDSGVAEKDIQTQYFNIRQVTRWDDVKSENIVIGYRVTNMVSAKIRDIDRTGTIIDAVTTAGGDLTRIDSIDFSIDDPRGYYEEARQEAVADARAKAEQLADLAGVNLGQPTYISEGAQSPPPIYRGGGIYFDEAMAMPVPETSISPGEMEVSLTVQVCYAILD